jgi:hypothetical protein
LVSGFPSPLSCGQSIATVEASSEVGYELSGEWMISERFGLEVSYLDARQYIEGDGLKRGEIDMSPWNFTLNWHLLDSDHFNWYLGPTVSLGFIRRRRWWEHRRR